MNPIIKAEWLRRLRSGEYQQGTGTLCRLRNPLDSNSPRSHCCLGVLSEIAVEAGIITPVQDGSCIRYDDSSTNLGHKIQVWAGLTRSNPMVDVSGRSINLANLNDDGMSFPKIADLIEEQL